MLVPDSGGGPARRMLLLVSKTGDGLAATLANGGGFPNGTTALVLEGAGAEPGLNPPVPRAPDAATGVLALGPYAVAIVTLGPS